LLQCSINGGKLGLRRGNPHISGEEEKLMAIAGRVVVTPDEEQPYKVVLEHQHQADTEHAVASVREGEALIREHLPGSARPELMRQWTARP
jgi:hypothetical protein